MEDKQKWHFFNLYCMAVADGSYAPQEREKLLEIAKAKGIDQKDIAEILTTSGLKQVIPTELEEKIEYLYDLACIAWADRVIEPDERTLMKKYVRLFGFDPDKADDIVDYILEKVKAGVPVEDIINEINN